MVKNKAKKTRLPYDFKPLQYCLALKLDDNSGRFTGQLTIEGQKMPPPSKRITLQQNALKVTGAKIIHKQKNAEIEFEFSRINHLKSFGEVRLHTKNIIYPGQYSVILEYSGKIPSDGFGRLNDYQTKWSDLVPCIDIPAIKSAAEVEVIKNNFYFTVCCSNRD
jgi:hypothetical protein